MRVAELAYDKRDYALSLEYFYKMQNVASNSQNIDVARLGILRCCYYLNNHEETVNIASIILETPQSKANIKDVRLKCTHDSYCEEKTRNSQQNICAAHDDIIELSTVIPADRA